MSVRVAFRHQLGAMQMQVDFEAPDGVTALFGRSGAGKTTVINAIAGLLTPDQGRIEVAGRVLFDSAAGLNVAVPKRRVGYVFQDARLFPHLDVRGNLTFGQRFAQREGPSLAHVAAFLGIEPLLDRPPATLSGGEQQRVAIGRALLAAPDILLMDEPLAALDEPRKAEILPYLERLRDESAVPVLYVSHSVPEVARLATTLVTMERGTVTRVGAARDILSDPSAVRMLGVRAAGAVLSARIAAHDPEDGLTDCTVSGGTIVVPLVDLPIGAEVQIRIEAHDVILARAAPEGLSALNCLPARVTEIHQGDGPGVAIGLMVGEDRLLARITKRSVRALGLEVGTMCHAVLKSTSIAQGDIAGG